LALPLPLSTLPDEKVCALLNPRKTKKNKVKSGSGKKPGD